MVGSSNGGLRAQSLGVHCFAVATHAVLIWPVLQVVD